MAKDFQGEKWKEVKLDFDFINNYRLEISNSGRLKSFNKKANGDFLEGSNGKWISHCALKILYKAG